MSASLLITNDAITAFVTAIISSATVLLGIWYREYLNRKSKLKVTVSIEDKSMFYLEMDKTCATIRQSLGADGSYLAYFHNGGTFGNGIAMDKFTVVGEDYNNLIRCKSYKQMYSNTMINYIPYSYHRLLTDNRYCVCDVENMTDLSFKSDLTKRNIASIYMFLIKDPISEKPIGFFGLEYILKFDMPKFNESEIWKHQNKLSKLLNMTVLNDAD